MRIFLLLGGLLGLALGVGLAMLRTVLDTRIHTLHGLEDITDRPMLGGTAVAASGKTKKQELTGAVRSLATAGVELLGTVVTMLPTKGPDSYGYGAYTYGATHVVAQAEPALSAKQAKPKRRGRVKVGAR